MLLPLLAPCGLDAWVDGNQEPRPPRCRHLLYRLGAVRWATRHRHRSAGSLALRPQGPTGSLLGTKPQQEKLRREQAADIPSDAIATSYEHGPAIDGPPRSDIPFAGPTRERSSPGSGGSLRRALEGKVAKSRRSPWGFRSHMWTLAVQNSFGTVSPILILG